MSETALQDAPSQAAETPAVAPEASQEASQGEPPKRKRWGKPFTFTKENARLYSAKGLETQRRMREEANKPKPPEPNEPPELKLALAECERVSAILAGKLKPLERAELMKAQDRAFDRVRIIRGQALPGTASSRAPAPTPSPVSRLLEAGSAPMTAPAARPTRDEQE